MTFFAFDDEGDNECCHLESNSAQPDDGGADIDALWNCPEAYEQGLLDICGISTSHDFLDTQPKDTNTTWFSTVQAWTIDRTLHIGFEPAQTAGLKLLIATFLGWLERWLDTDSSPFIHPQLYRSRHPRCVQDAYTTLCSYFRRTQESEQTVFRIIEDRVGQLLLDYGINRNDISAEYQGSDTFFDLDALEHLARVQALLVYQTLSLYNGDVRLRTIAEASIPVLSHWMELMVKHASQSSCLGSTLISPTASSIRLDGTGSVLPIGRAASAVNATSSQHLLWTSWILGESIRRTWLLASGIQGSYIIMKQGHSMPCQGGVNITTRNGLWDAGSASKWARLCSDAAPGFLQVADSGTLFTDVGPDGVDEFTHFILQATFGQDRYAQWAEGGAG